MDANGLNFWMLSSHDDWLPPGGSPSLYYCASKRRLQLRSVRTGSPPVEEFGPVSSLLNVAPMARDAFGNYARWDPASGRVMAGGSGPVEVPIYTPPPGLSVSDLALGFDGILYIAMNNVLVMVDRRGRWPDFTLSDLAGFAVWRLLALPEGGVLALDRGHSQLGKFIGAPLQTGPADTPNPGILRSCQENPDPPRLAQTYALPPGEVYQAFTAMGGRIALISWQTNTSRKQGSFLRLFSFDGGFSLPSELEGILWPYSVAWLGDQKLAVLVTGINEALVYDLRDSALALVPAGDTYVLSGKDKGPFAHSLDALPYYQDGLQLLPLLPLSLNSLAATNSTDPPLTRIVDSGVPQTVWHRLFLEALIPPRCGVTVWLTASDNRTAIAGSKDWYPHAFGEADASPLPAESPRGVWLPNPSEIPFAQPLLGDPPEPNRQGLFMALIQRAGKRVRTLQGRFLGVRIQLDGDRRSTPEVAAVRLYASRFSYVDHYLPEIYRESLFGPDADLPGAATRTDFLERFVDIFEAQLTRVEDRVAHAYLLTRPESTPDDALDWLGSWIGLDPAGYPPDRRRARLLAAPELHRLRGAVQGVTLALDIATNGLCTRGAVLVLEDFRLRHTFATILGADLSIQNDPLLPGHSPSGNSIVGDTLFLGDPHDQTQLLALFGPDIATARESRAVEQFFDNLAHRMTIFIHDQVEQVDINLIQRVVDQEKPAHVAATIRRATQPFLIGLASLLGVNSYLSPEPPPDPVVVDVTRIGRYSLVMQPPSLDPRLV
jgi:phage tail-like protein